MAPGSKPAASLFYPSPTHHFITGPGALALELGKLSTVVDGDEQFPDGQECHSNQEDAANHSQQDGHGIGGTSALCKEGARRQVGKTISTPAMSEVKGYTLPSVHPPSCCLCETESWTGCRWSPHGTDSKIFREFSNCLKVTQPSGDRNEASGEWLDLYAPEAQVWPSSSAGGWATAQLLYQWLQEQTRQAGGSMHHFRKAWSGARHF